MAQEKKKPCLVVDLAEKVDVEAIRVWLEENHIETLNVAGPRESKRPGIYGETLALLERLSASS